MTDDDTGEVFEDPRPRPPQMPPLDLTHATPELFAALAEAQARVSTVGKAALNKHAGYKYATADSMLRGAREARAGTGLALFSTWTFTELDGAQAEDGQWVCAIVTLHFVLTHASGGRLSGKLSIHAIGSKRRPPDKALAAAATYAEGFVERNLMRLDRAEEVADDVDQREETDTRRRPPARNGQRGAALTLADCTTAEDLAAWCKVGGIAAVTRYGRGAVLAKATARCATLGISAEWLGAALGLDDSAHDAQGDRE